MNRELEPTKGSRLQPHSNHGITQVRSLFEPKKTRANGIYVASKEHYLRNDIRCGCGPCVPCSKLPLYGEAIGQISSSASIVLVPDITAVLYQMDLLESGLAPLSSLLFLQNVVSFTRQRSSKLYERLRALLSREFLRDTNKKLSSVSGKGERGIPIVGVQSETAAGSTEIGSYALFCNMQHEVTFLDRLEKEHVLEYESRCILRAVQFLTEHWKPLGIQPILLTNERKLELEYKDSKEFKVISVSSLVKQYEQQYPRMLEMLAFTGVDDPQGDSEITTDDAEDQAVGAITEGFEEDGSAAGFLMNRKRRALFREYLGEKEVTRRLKAGELHQGVFRVSPYNLLEANVNIALDRSNPDVRTSILVVGKADQNRALDGDHVVVEVYDPSQWKQVSNKIVDQEQVETQDAIGEEDTNEKNGHKKGTAMDTTDSESVKRLPTGRIVAVTKRNWRPYCGAIQESSYMGGDSALFLPVDRKIPKIRIRSKRLNEMMHQRVLVVLDGWDRTSSHPNGHVIQQIGTSGDKNAETEVILMENGIPTRKFSQAAMACLPDPDWQVGEDHLQKRWDLTDRPVCSVDPPGCTDIDDALHCIKLNNPYASDQDGSKDLYEVGIHIADVTAFVQHGSALDREAAERGTTVYLVDRRIEMLPTLLTSNLCSLMGNVKRLAFSVLLKMDRDANVISAEFGRSVIRSREAMTYEKAQNRLDTYRTAFKSTETDGKELESGKKKGSGKSLSAPQGIHSILPPSEALGTSTAVGCKDSDRALNESLLNLATLAAKLRERRMQNGALSLASPEVKFEVQNETNDVTDVKLYEVRETNKMVEEFMLLANIEVAKRILQQFPKCSMLRRHPRPSAEMFEPLVRTAANYNIPLDISSSKTLNDSLEQVERTYKKTDPYLSTLLRILTTRCMTQAVYFSSGEISQDEYLHYGLATPVYTHFTSPIRRYADVIVHRQLQACIGYSALPMDLYDSKRMNSLAQQINERHKSAQQASRGSIVLHTTMLFRDKTLVEEGRILRVQKNGLVVLIPKYGLEGIVLLDESLTPQLDKDAQLVKLSTGKEFRVMSRVKVQVTVDSNPERSDRVVFQLAD